VIGRFRGLIELALACAALVGAGLSWSHAREMVGVAPIADGQPATTSLVYHPQLLLLTLVLATIAGVLAVVGAARLRRARRVPNPHADGLN
jgi:NO-binding membrane sensor protein with MHYT domain